MELIRFTTVVVVKVRIFDQFTPCGEYSGVEGGKLGYSID